MANRTQKEEHQLSFKTFLSRAAISLVESERHHKIRQGEFQNHNFEMR